MSEGWKKTKSEGVNTSSDFCIQAPFDYKTLFLSTPDEEFLKSKALTIKTRTLQTIIDNGRDLIEAKDRIQYGVFTQWVEKCLGLSRERASEYMRIASGFKCAPGALLDEFQKKALVLLSSKSTPDSARQEALVRAESGEKISAKLAKEIADRHKKELAEKDSIINSLTTPKQPDHNNLIPGLLKKYKGAQITPGMADRLSVLDDGYQQTVLSLLDAQYFSERELTKAVSEKVKAMEEVSRLAREKEGLQLQLSNMDEVGASKLIREKDREIELLKQEHRRKILEVKHNTGKEASEFHEKRFKEQLEDAEDDRKRLVRKAKEEHEKATAAWQAQKDLQAKIAKLESQLEVNSPTNVDNARVRHIEDAGRGFLIAINELRKDMETIGGGMDRSLSITDDILKQASLRLAELQGAQDSIINI